MYYLPRLQEVVAYKRWLLTRGGCLQEVVAYKRFQILWFELETFGILENWSLRRGGRLQVVVTTSSLTNLNKLIWG